MAGSHSGDIKRGIGGPTQTGAMKLDLLEVEVWQRLMSQADLIHPPKAASLMSGVQGVLNMITLTPFKLPIIHRSAHPTSVPALILDLISLRKMLLSRGMLPRRILQIFNRRRLRPVFMVAVVALVITEIVAFSPSSVEEGGTKSAAVDPDTLLDNEEGTLATGIPNHRIAEYTVDQFQYVSTQGGEKQWKLIATKAFLYSKEKLVHARQIRAFLFDPDGKITVVTGKEAKYFMNQRDLEVFGDVHTVFPDGFELNSDYLRYRPGERKIEIPIQYFVRGDGNEKDGQNIQFESYGLDFAMARSTIILPQDVKLTMEKRTTPGPSPAPVLAGSPPVSKTEPERTVIHSDRAVIYRDKQISHFTMRADRPLTQRFVRITQPTMFTRARRAELRYGDFSSLLQYMVVFDDVLIKDTGTTASLRYATGGRADFDAQSDVIKLTKFPQAYQDNDTVTGDIIIMHRDSDLVEVEHSNAFSQGN